MAMNGKHEITPASLEQLASQIMLWPKPCIECGANAVLGRSNQKMIPRKILQVTGNQAQVSGEVKGIDGFLMCLACDRRSKIMPKDGHWAEVVKEIEERESVPGPSASPGGIG